MLSNFKPGQRVRANRETLKRAREISRRERARLAHLRARMPILRPEELDPVEKGGAQ